MCQKFIPFTCSVVSDRLSFLSTLPLDQPVQIIKLAGSIAISHTTRFHLLPTGIYLLLKKKQASWVPQEPTTSPSSPILNGHHVKSENRNQIWRPPKWCWVTLGTPGSAWPLPAQLRPPPGKLDDPSNTRVTPQIIRYGAVPAATLRALHEGFIKSMPNSFPSLDQLKMKACAQVTTL